MPSIFRYPIHIKSAESQKDLFYICLAGFLLYNLYGCIFYKLRFEVEGASWFSIWMAKGGFGIAWHRFAFALTKFMVPLFYKLHFPFKAIVVLACIHDALFFLGIAWLVIIFTNKYNYAACVLASQILINGGNFYFIINELFISGGLMILYVACYKHMQRGALRWMVLAGSMFFIVWSNPVMLVVLFVFMFEIYKSFSQIKRDAIMLIGIVFMVIIRISFLSQYDLEKINVFSGSGFSGNYIYDVVKDYLCVYWYIALIITWFAYRCLIKQMGWLDFAGLIITPILLYYSSIHYTLAHNIYFAKYMYPAHLFILYKMAEQFETTSGYSLSFLMPLVAIVLFAGAIDNIRTWHQLLTARYNLITTLNKWCSADDPKQSKWFVKEKSLCFNDEFDVRYHTESLFFSAIEQPAVTIQLVRANEPELKQIPSTPATSVFISEKLQLSIDELNPFYFHIQKGPYKELIIDSVRLEEIRKFSSMQKTIR